MDLKPDFEDKTEGMGRKLHTQFIITCFLLIFATLFIGIIANLMLTKNYVAILWLTVFIVINGILAILYLYRKWNVLIANAIVLMVITAYSIYLNVGEFRVFVLYLFPGVPVITLFLTGRIKGSLYTLLALFITLFFLLTNRDSWQATGFNYGSLVNFLVGNAAFFTLLLFYEFGVSESQKSLQAINKKLRTVSITDHLTQLYNREWLVGRLQSLIREQRKFTIILGDLDGFKRVNDQYGHSEGDLVLKTVTKMMLDTINKDDCSLGRYGGDEFLIIAENASLNEAVKKAKRLSSAINESANDLKAPLTISFGVASFHKDDTVDSLVKRADQALYNSKKAGKNTVLSERTLKETQIDKSHDIGMGQYKR